VRLIENPQQCFGEVSISAITFDEKTRDDIPAILKGLQYIYCTEEVRAPVFSLLEERLCAGASRTNGRPGMALWKILVMGVLRLDLNCDYDRLRELVNHHDTIRQMLGHGDLFDKSSYHIQTLKDNVSLLTPELLDEINQIVVSSGHMLVKKKADARLRGRCDSFVVETDVHYPTDINLLFDAMRKVIQLTGRLCSRLGLSDWRQHAYNVRYVKRAMRKAQSQKRGGPGSEEKRQARVIASHETYLDVSREYLRKAQLTLSGLTDKAALSASDEDTVTQIEGFMSHATRQIDQIHRRVMLGETIPHEEKVFSIFEPHTEWVVKGKAGVPVELGLKVCILEDQHQFILHHHVMEKQTDADVAVLMVDEAKQRFSGLSTCSFDKGFHSPENQIALAKRLDVAAVKRKGKLSKSAYAIEHSDEFLQARKKHSAVESAINGLEVHGLDRCPDQGIDGFKRYVALAVLARNIHRIGALLLARDHLREKRKRYAQRQRALKLAA